MTPQRGAHRARQEHSTKPEGVEKQKVHMRGAPAFYKWFVERLASDQEDGSISTAATLCIDSGIKRLTGMPAVIKIIQAREVCLQDPDPVVMTTLDDFEALAIATADSPIEPDWQVLLPAKLVKKAGHLATKLGMPRSRLLIYALSIGLRGRIEDIRDEYRNALDRTIRRLHGALERKAVLAAQLAAGEHASDSE